MQLAAFIEQRLGLVVPDAAVIRVLCARERVLTKGMMKQLEEQEWVQGAVNYAAVAALDSQWNGVGEVHTWDTQLSST